MKKTSSWKKGLVVIMALCMVICASFSAFAANAQWTYPTAPMQVDENVITISAHGSAEPLPGFMGANLLTARPLLSGATTADEIFAAAQEKAFLGVFGSKANANPDPYIWNYFYNTYAAANGLPVSEDAVWDVLSGGPMNADTTIIPEYGTSGSLACRPDIIIGINPGKDGVGYETLIADLPENKDADPNNDYAPLLVAYNPNTTAGSIETLHNVAAAMEKLIAEGKTVRYGSPATLAVEYENYVRGMQFYVLSELEEKNLEKKTVAVISPTDLGDGTFNAYTSAQASGTAASVRGCEYSELTTKNIVDVLGLTESEGTYKIKAEQLLEADVIFIFGTQGGTMSTDDFITMLTDKYKVNAQKLMQIPIYSTPPTMVFGISMNSIENAIGYGLFQGFQYYDYTGLNPVHSLAYFYEKFYHLTDMETVANALAVNFEGASLPAGVTASLSGYSLEGFEDMLAQGMQYYKDHESEYVGTKYEWNLDYTKGIGTRLASKADAFTDIVGHWAESNIRALVDRGMFNGMSATTFEPETTMSKGMILTVLYRYDGQPAAGANPFSDIAAGEWYTDGICWAVNNGLIKGKTATTFGPNDTISREELASVLFNYAKYKGLSITERSNLAKYTDKPEIQSEYLGAVQWAVGNGIINGRTATTIVPAGTASRAEVVTMLDRFLTILEK